MRHSAVVLFSSNLPDRSKAWWQQFSVLIAPEALAPAARERSLAFEAIENYIDPGSIQRATDFLHELATIALPDGRRASESASYHGFELWWLSYDELFYRQCVPYTQYKRLLEHLSSFSGVTLETPPAAALFSAYLSAHRVPYEVTHGPRTFPALGIWLQVFLSLLSWPVLIFRRPPLLLYTGDLFDPPRDYSFRMRLIYEELRKKNLPFVEFIRSMEPGGIMLSHAWKRRRPVIYSYAIKIVLSWLAGRVPLHIPESADNPQHAFKLALALAYLENSRGAIWSIKVMNWLVRSIGIQVALIPAASSRTFQEVLGCRLAGIPTIGILHGAASKYYNVYDFIPEYRGAKRLSLDTYGMWSNGWRDYYLSNGKVYGIDQLVVSGPMRPAAAPPPPPVRREGPVKVLFVPGELSAPQEILPYVRALRNDPDIAFYLTFRPYRDAFETWLRKNDSAFLESFPRERIFRGRNIQQDIAECDVVVGTYSTSVLEALLQSKPLVFFNTAKWGDYFDLENYRNSKFFAHNADELASKIKHSGEVSTEEITYLRERFFGDPTKNGSAWLIDEAQKHL